MSLNPRTVTALKLVVCALALGTLALKAGQLVAPQAPAWQVLLVSALVMAGIITAAVLSLVIGQMVLHAGGKDAQWFWFASDPPGLETLRHSATQPKHQ